MWICGFTVPHRQKKKLDINFIYVCVWYIGLMYFEYETSVSIVSIGEENFRPVAR